MNTGNRAPTKPGFLAVLLVLTFVQAVNVRAQDRLPPISPEKMTEAQKKPLQTTEPFGKPILPGRHGR